MSLIDRSCRTAFVGGNSTRRTQTEPDAHVCFRCCYVDVELVCDLPVRAVAERVGATPAQVGLAWLLAHDDAILLIPGTSSVEEP